MKTLRLFGMLLLAISLCLSACGEIENPIEPTPDPKPEEVKSEITIDNNIITNGFSFTSEAGEKSISFTTNENWTLSIATTQSGDAWCTASATSGAKGNVNVKFSVTENTSYDSRSVSVTIKSGTASKTFTITQKYAEALLLTTNKYELSQDGGTIEIEVKANIDYEMEIADNAKNWITEAKTRTLTTYKHALNIAPNEEVEKREGEIYFKSGDKVESVKIYQAGGAIILLSKDEYIVSDAGETISIDIKSNIEYGVQMPDVDWITEEPTTRGMSSHTLRYTISPNEEYDSRTADIVFYDKNSDLKETVKIVQVQKDAIILSQKEYEIAAAGETIEVKLSANIEFEINMPNADWIEQVNTRAMQEHTLYFKVAENKTEEKRSADIAVVSSDSKLSETIAIIQQGNYTAVTLREAGTLKSALGDDYLNITSLKIVGPINGDDVKVLREMLCVSDMGYGIKGGILTSLDLSDTSIVEGGDAYYKFNTTSYTSNNTIGENFFIKCSNLTSIVLPKNITAIGGNAFHTASSLTSIVIPDSVTSIDYFAFYNCKNLTSIKIGKGVTTIEQSAFYNCTSLTSIVIPDNVTSIGSGVFYDCTALQSVTIGKGVTSIGGAAFRGCSSLQSIVIPDNVTSIGQSVFADCSALSSIEFGDGITSIDNLELNKLSSLSSVIIGDSVTSIGAKTFADCYYLSSVTIGKGVASIGEDAFYECSALRSIVIPDNVTSIGDSAFCNCYSLQSVAIGKGVTSIGEYAFYECSALKSIVIPDNVTSIGKRAFERCSVLKDVVISDKVTSIDEMTFYVCSSLSNLTIGKGVISIGEDAFGGCDALESVVIPDNVTTIGKLAFSGCDALKSITIGKGVTTIGNDAFGGCNIEQVYIKDLSAWCNIDFEVSPSLIICDSNPVDGAKLFIDNNEVTELIIPDDITYIKKFAFVGCKSIKSLKIHDRVTSIGDGSFNRCSSLTTVTIGKGIIGMGSNAFSNTSINEFYCADATPPVLSSSYYIIDYGILYNPTYHTFYAGYGKKYGTLYVPFGRKTAYEDEDWLQYFNNIVEME